MKTRRAIETRIALRAAIRFCSGPCGRPLDGLDRPLNRHGNPGAQCRRCYKAVKRNAARRRYKGERRETMRARRRRYYWNDPERGRQVRRDYYWRVKVAA